MALSFIFGSLYWTNVLWSTITNLGRSIRPVSFIYINYLLVHSINPCSYILSIFLVYSMIPTLFLVSSIDPLLIKIRLIFGLLYKPILFLFLGLSIRPISLHWAILVYQSIQNIGLLYRTSLLILVPLFLGLFYYPYYFLVLFLFLGRYRRPISYLSIYFLGLIYWPSSIIRHFLILGYSMIPVFRWFLENVPCSLLSGSMPWLFSPTSASPLGFVRSSLFLFLYFLSSYPSSYYYLIQENLRDHRDERGAKWDSKRKKEREIKKIKEKILIFSFL